jgi:hypothetical protein
LKSRYRIAEIVPNEGCVYSAVFCKNNLPAVTAGKMIGEGRACHTEDQTRDDKH